jgi:hypothetical protein
MWALCVVCGEEGLEDVEKDGDIHSIFVSQPYFEKSVRMRLTLPKWELGSPLGLPKFQSSIAGFKTPCIRAFFITLKSYRSVDVENGLA